MREPVAAIVLAGGGSRRMGTPKALLEWHGSTLVRHAAGLLGRAAAGPIVVVRAKDQELPALPPGVELAVDARPGRGPLQGIAAGLSLIGDRAGAVYVTGVDAPLLHPAFVRHVVRSLGAHDDVALPQARGFAQPLAAAYRTSIAPCLQQLIARDRLSTKELFAALRVRELDEAALLEDPDIAAFDPALDSLVNLNEPGEYERARARPAPCVAVRGSPEVLPHTIRAATLGAAAAAVGVTLGARTVARLEGHGTVDDPHEPLVAGDALTFGAPAA